MKKIKSENPTAAYTGYRCRHFKLYELLPKELYIDEDMGWDLFDERILRTIDIIREIVGVKLICNNWYWKGKRNWSGARNKNSPDFRIGSCHSIREDRKVMALDVISPAMSAAEMRRLIVQRHTELPCPIRIEDGVSWLHVDVKEQVGYMVYFFKA